MILRASYGVRGALFPGLLRAVLLPLCGLACNVTRGHWPVDSDWQNLAGIFDSRWRFHALGLSLPGLITFLLFWLVNVGLVLAAEKF